MIWVILLSILDVFLACAFGYGVWFLCKNFKEMDWQVIVIRIILAIVVLALFIYTIKNTVYEINLL